MKIFTQKRILIISPEPWEHNFLSKHHYAMAFANAGNMVFFLNPPSDNWKCEPSGISNLFILNYKPLMRGLNRLPLVLSRLFWYQDVRRIEALAGGKFAVVWSFDPYRFQNLTVFKSAFTLYYAADWHENRRLEEEISRYVSCVLSPSSVILENIRSNAQKMKVSHGVADYFFTKVKSYSLPGHNVIKVGYVGNLMIKSLDKALLLSLIRENQQVDFIFVGAGTGWKHDPAWREILLHTNVFFLGPLLNRDIPAFLQSCDVLLLVYDTIRYAKEASNSHKVLEYLSSGKTVLSTPMAEYMNIDEIISMPRQYTGFVTLFKKVVHQLGKYNSPERMRLRIDYAWHRRYEAILRQIDEALFATGSVNAK